MIRIFPKLWPAALTALWLLGCTSPTPTATPTPDWAAARFSPTGSLSNSRGGHTATLLSDGVVLVTGGDCPPGFSSAEVYEPSNGQFELTGGLTACRHGHTATLLPAGKVLITGGINTLSFTEFDTLASAEVFDPSTGIFTSTGSMSTPRSHHTATLLPNGKVLVTGGGAASAKGGKEADVRTLVSSDIYDPLTGRFTATARMTIARSSHTATLLPDGRVLITGGTFDEGPHQSEIYDPATGTFSMAGAMSTGRRGHTATLLSDGRVLVIGGFAGLLRVLASAEVYDPIEGAFRPTGGMTTERQNHTATPLPNGMVLIIGGRDSDVRVLPSAEIYDPVTGRFTATTTMRIGRDRHGATLLSDGLGVLITGGFGGLTSGGGLRIIRSTELYSPDSAR